jgi:hypothetical protein
MALVFIVEDGSGVEGATSYVALADAEQYFDNRPSHALIAYWTGTDEAKHGALNQATAFLDTNYQWVQGYKLLSTNPLDWPRGNAYDSSGYAIGNDTIPPAVQDSVCELAIRVLSGIDLLADEEQTVDSAKIGPLDVAFQDGSSPTVKYPYVTKLLRGLIGSSSFRKVVRG